MSDTQRYTFTGINHRKDGELLESGTEVELTDSEYAAAPHKFEPVSDADASSESSANAAADSDGEDTDFTGLDGVGPATADELHAAGYDSFADLREASVDDLTDVTNVSADDAESIHEQIDDSEG